MKICTTCKIEKDFSEFGLDNKSKDKHQSSCFPCRKEYRTNNKKFIAAGNKRYYENNKERLNTQNKEYADANKEHLHQKSKEYYENNKDNIKKRVKKYANENKEHLSMKQKERYVANEDLPEFKEKRRNYKKNRSSTDTLFNLSENIRRLIRDAIRNKGYTKKSNKTLDILGCCFHHFKQHIESQFVDGMSWENRKL